MESKTPSIPADFKISFDTRFANQVSNIDHVLNSESPVSIRFHPKKSQKINSLNALDNYVRWNKYGRYLSNRPKFSSDPLWHSGAYYVQEASSMAVIQAASDIQLIEGCRVLDLCGAPGGKSTLIADFLESKFKNYLLISNEVVKTRANTLRDNMIRWGYTQNIVINNDPSQIAQKLGNYFDLILVDAPCSGEGMFRKDYEARREWSLENVHLCDLRQKRILEQALRLLKPSGHIIYSTCTFNDKENIDQISHLIETYKLNSLEIKGLQKDGVVEIKKKSALGYQFIPGLIKGEGFFISLLQKQDGPSRSWRASKKMSITEVKNSPFKISEEELVFEDEFGSLRLLRKEMAKEYLQIASMFYTRKLGLELGKRGRKEFIPSHDLALSTRDLKLYEDLELTKNQAIDYLSKASISDTTGQGWHRVTYEGLGLGWIKLLKNRQNNYYPKNLRILKK